MDGSGAHSIRLDFFDGLLSLALAPSVIEGNVDAFAGECQADAAADSLRSPRDERSFTVKFFHWIVANGGGLLTPIPQNKFDFLKNRLFAPLFYRPSKSHDLFFHGNLLVSWVSVVSG